LAWTKTCPVFVEFESPYEVEKTGQVFIGRRGLEDASG
jgi:hypothetical protein